MADKDGHAPPYNFSVRNPGPHQIRYHAKPCVTISGSDLSSDTSQLIVVDANVPDNLRWSTASATQPHIDAHSDSGELTGTQSLEDSANDAGQQMSAHQTRIDAGSKSGQPITARNRKAPASDPGQPKRPPDELASSSAHKVKKSKMEDSVKRMYLIYTYALCFLSIVVLAIIF